MLKVDYAKWGQTPENLRLLSVENDHPRTRERFLEHDALRAKKQGKNQHQKKFPTPPMFAMIPSHYGNYRQRPVHSQKDSPRKLAHLPCHPHDAGHMVCGLQCLESYQLPRA